MQTIKVKHNQSLADIAIQEYGSIEGLFLIVEDNPTLNGITDNVFFDDELLIRDKAINSQMKNYLATETIATVKGARGEGIGYMRIGTDFIVN